ncbi:hypothetical protein [Streptomyces sp. SM12]|uniref:hypothetical protein n=1 Tax=Streptomyces sp. SM12 TaxID=1071602 RepID=UPI000CD4B678|nr:hypothetical protein [Streptomyces sp. SM12]
MKFDMGTTALPTLNKDTDLSSEQLVALVDRLVASVEPLEGKFSGRGRAAFQQFKNNTDEIAASLGVALGRIREGQAGMTEAFFSGDEQQETAAQRSMGAQNFDAARF